MEYAFCQNYLDSIWTQGNLGSSKNVDALSLHLFTALQDKNKQNRTTVEPLRYVNVIVMRFHLKTFSLPCLLSTKTPIPPCVCLHVPETRGIHCRCWGCQFHQQLGHYLKQISNVIKPLPIVNVNYFNNPGNVWGCQICSKTALMTSVRSQPLITSWFPLPSKDKLF